MTKECPTEQEYRSGIVQDIRPWGRYRSYPYEQARSIKIITVSPGATLSLQYHRRRCEFWIVLDPGLEITVGDRVWRPEADEEVYIPMGVPHRLSCVGPEAGRVMELWLGDSEESDIVRLGDVYGRK